MRSDEQGLLAALMTDSRQILELDLGPEHFSTQQGGGLYGAMLKLATKGVTIDPNTLAAEYTDRTAVADLMAATGSPANVTHYAQTIRDAARLRAVVSASKEAIKAAEGKGAEPDAVIDQLMQAITVSQDTRETWDMASLQRHSLAEIERTRELRSQGKVVGVPTGFSVLDKMLTGLRDGRLYIVGARPKMGKTSLALSIQHNAARAGYNVGFASAEMAAPECNLRWLSCVAGVEAERLQSGQISESDSRRVAEASNRLASLPIFILDKAAASPSRIRRQAMAWKSRYGLDVLMVDYLQRLTPDDKGERRDLVVGEMARAFKNVARDLGIPVVLLAQLSRGLEAREDKRPLPSDLRDSGEIEQEADVVAFLYRDAVYNEDADHLAAEILVPMNRAGRSGRVQLTFDARFQRWLDKDIADYEVAA